MLFDYLSEHLRFFIMRQITWWKLVIVQLIGVIIIFLIPFLGIDRLIILTFGSHTGIESVIPMIMIIFPAFIGWDRKIKGWWIPLFLVLIPLCVGIIKIIPMYIEKICG